MAEVARERFHNQDDRLELLLFDLGDTQHFGINVLKVKEVIPCPHLTQVPHAHAAVRGVAHLRGEALTVIDLAMAIGRRLAATAGEKASSVIVTEFNRNMQGFLVAGVERIVVCDWKQVLPPPKGTGLGSYITGVTRIENELVQILDVEKILGEVVAHESIDAIGIEDPELHGRRVLIVDDSSVARRKTAQTLDQMGIEYLMARDGREALQLLQELRNERPDEMVEMVISDIEMPEMDGYNLTRELKQDTALRDLYVLLHTSLNGAINTEKAGRVGADAVLTKFVPEELARAVAAGLLTE